MLWRQYRARHGSFSIGHRVELAGAIVAQQVHASVPRKSGYQQPNLAAFMPHWQQPGNSGVDGDDESELLERAMRDW